MAVEISPRGLCALCESNGWESCPTLTTPKAPLKDSGLPPFFRPNACIVVGRRDCIPSWKDSWIDDLALINRFATYIQAF